MIILSGYLLLCRRAVFETGAREAREALAVNIVPHQTTAAETLSSEASLPRGHRPWATG